MNRDRMTKRIMGMLLALVLLLGSGVILQTTAQAQFRGRGAYSREEQNRGYRDGRDRGEEDARDRRRYDPNNSEHYRRGNNAYREGFRRGYADGYRRNARYRR